MKWNGTEWNGLKLKSRSQHPQRGARLELVDDVERLGGRVCRAARDDLEAALERRARAARERRDDVAEASKGERGGGERVRARHAATNTT